ncbi:MAG: peptidoglycan DD-metalloendopeptidase family protein [Lautropia sp.]
MQTSAGKQLASALVAALSVATLTAFAVAPLTEQPLPPRSRVIEPLQLAPVALPLEGNYLRQTVVTRGESLGSLLRRLGEQDATLTEFVRTDPVARQLLRIPPGTTVRAEVDGRDRIRALSYALAGFSAADARRLDIERGAAGWHAQVAPLLVERTVVTRTATLTSSLFAATDAAGIPDAITAKIPEIFASDMDFHREVKKGDRLRIAYEMFSDPSTLSDGQPGRILAVEYVSRTKRLEAVWFERDGGGDYYNFDGHTLRKTFLRSPMEFTRISSGFTLGRRHPVFRDWRAHKGIDYAAPTGTPIRSVGDGVVEFAGNQRGYGNVVIIRHDKENTTLYAHMRAIGEGISENAKIRQGQVIGTVGQSGWASGPHLHFEFHVNGEQVDPASMMPPPEEPMDASARLRFRESTQELLARMRWQDAAQVAAFE